ncbi:hypothetical protein EV182_001205, partial [Spiromyces aspiralis]
MVPSEISSSDSDDSLPATQASLYEPVAARDPAGHDDGEGANAFDNCNKTNVHVNSDSDNDGNSSPQLDSDEVHIKGNNTTQDNVVDTSQDFRVEDCSKGAAQDIDTIVTPYDSDALLSDTEHGEHEPIDSEVSRGAKRPWSLMFREQQDETLRLEKRISFEAVPSGPAQGATREASPSSLAAEKVDQASSKQCLDGLLWAHLVPTSVMAGPDGAQRAAGPSQGALVHAEAGTIDTVAMASYKLETVVTLSGQAEPGQDDSDESIACEAIISPARFAVFIGNQIFMMQSEIKGDCVTIHHAFSKGSEFIAFGDEMGTLNLIHIASKRLLFSQVLHDRTGSNEEASGRLQPRIVALDFFETPMNGTEELVVITDRCVLYRFSGIDVAGLDNAIKAGDMAAATRLKSCIQIERVVLGDAVGSVHDFACLRTRNASRVFVCGCGPAALTVWERREDNGGSKIPGQKTKLIDRLGVPVVRDGYKKAELTQDGRVLVVLDITGALCLHNTSTMTLFSRYTGLCFDDFYIIAAGSEGHPSGEPVSAMPSIVVGLTKATQTPGSQLSRAIVMLSIPVFRVLFSLPVSPTAFLVKDTRPVRDSGDPIVFVEGTAGPGRGQWSLHVRALTQSLPYDRLRHYLRRGDYGSALEFAKHHNLDMEIVYKQKLYSYTGNDPAMAPPSFDAQTFIEACDQVRDDAFVVSLCMQARPRSLTCVQKILRYAQKRASDPAQLELVQRTVQRLGTWSLLRPLLLHDAPKDSSSRLDFESWHEFRGTNLAMLVRRLIATSNIAHAAIVWRRHHQSDSIIKEDVADALQMCPEDIEDDVLIEWIKRDVIPHTPERLHRDKLAQWYEKRARRAERGYGGPDAALKWLQLLDGHGANTESSGGHGRTDCRHGKGDELITPAQYIWSKAAGSDAPGNPRNNEGTGEEPRAGDSLANLRRDLADIVYLRDRHGLTISLDEYSALTLSSVTIKLLDKAASPRAVKDTYSCHFLSYCSRHGLDAELLIQEYTSDLMGRVSINGCQGSQAETSEGCEDECDYGASWEPRVLVLLECLLESNLCDRRPLHTCFEICLELMRRTSVPWSGAVEGTIQRFLRLCESPPPTHPDIRHQAAELREQYRLMCLKRMLLSYGIHSFNISRPKLAKNLVRRILKHTDKDGVVNDALQIAEAYATVTRMDVYMTRMVVLCQAGLTEELRKLIINISELELTDADRHGKESFCGDHLVQPRTTAAVATAVHIVKLGIVWIKRVLDALEFQDPGAPRLLKQYVGCAQALLQTANELCEDRAVRDYCQDELRKFTLIHALVYSEGMLVSPSEIEDGGITMQILADLADQCWRRRQQQQQQQPANSPS